MKYQALIEQLKAFYSALKTSKMEQLNDLYAPDIRFTDPVHQVQGLENLTEYLENTIKNVEYCHFTFTNELFSETGGYLTWDMHFAHPKLRGGKEIIVPGVSQLVFNQELGKIQAHTDFYDMGALLYEHIPGVGWVTKKVKSGMKSA